MKLYFPQQRKEQEDVRQPVEIFHETLTLTISSHRRTVLRTDRHVAGEPLMLLALSSNRLGLSRLLRRIQHGCRMAKRCWTGPPVFHAAQLHGIAHAKDSESLPLSMSDHRRDNDLPWVYDTTGSKH